MTAPSRDIEERGMNQDTREQPLTAEEEADVRTRHENPEPVGPPPAAVTMMADRGADPLREAARAVLAQYFDRGHEPCEPETCAVAALRAALGEEPHGR